MLKRCLRVLSMVLLAALGTSVLMYSAPGYFSEEREMDAAHAQVARTDLSELREHQRSLPQLLRAEASSWAHGDLGQSRQYGVPVQALLRERIRASGVLLCQGVALGWALALLFAVPASLIHGRSADVAIAGATALLLAVPVGALATLCLVGNVGGPAFVLGMAVAARDLKLLHRILCGAWSSPFILHARAQGMSSTQILRCHLLVHLRQELLGVAALSFTLALSALVPVEVIFDLPGLGHLAWSAAMNRDLPVLVAVTSILAACLGFATTLATSVPQAGEARCAG